MPQLIFIKTDSGYEAKTKFGTYTIWKIGTRFILRTDDEPASDSLKTTLANCKVMAQETENGRVHAAEAAAKREQAAKARAEAESAARIAREHPAAVREMNSKLKAGELELIRGAAEDVAEEQALQSLLQKAGPFKEVEIKEAQPKPVSPMAAKLGSRVQPGSFGQAPHLIIVARAGTGKTTTLLEGTKLMMGMKSSMTPSPQQKAVWEAMVGDGTRPMFVCFCAFNSTIASELKGRVPLGCEAKTIHAHGYGAVRRAFPGITLDKHRTRFLMAGLMGCEIEDLRRDCITFMNNVEELVAACKLSLADPTDEKLAELTDRYDLDLENEQAETFEMVRDVLELAAQPHKDNMMDFNDMVWLPVKLRLSVFKYDVMLVDEVQDLNRAQQALARMSARRLIFCGDDRQAIYGFAMADSDSLDTLKAELSTTPQGCTVLPLTVTRRCGKKIVAEARNIVPDFEAFEANGEGVVRRAAYPGERKSHNYWLGKSTVKPEDSWLAEAQPGDMAVCRVNAPLVSQCFRLLRMGKRAFIEGRKIGEGLVTFIGKLAKDHEGTDRLVAGLEAWREKETKTENAKKNPSEAKLLAIQDKADCLMEFCSQHHIVKDVKAKIAEMFEDGNKISHAVRLSSIHKCKGLEANRVFFLEPEGATVPHPMAKKDWAIEQEWNLRYVAITRAIKELVYVC